MAPTPPHACKLALARFHARARAAQVSCGADHTVLLGGEGQVYAWGRGLWGQCGSGMSENQAYPREVGGLPRGNEGGRIVQVGPAFEFEFELAWSSDCP